MSYNTRRTGTGAPGRGSSTTQVNYHQQPSRTGNPAQSRNPGYTTTQQSNYNNSQGGGYSTQPGYTTSQPPLPTSQPTKPSQPQLHSPLQSTTAAAQQPAAQQPAPPPQAKQTPPPSTPVLKQEPPATPAADTTARSETTENGDGTTPKPFWKKRPFVKVSNKVRKARQNAKLRRILNPKNALTFLNEMRPGGVKFNVREEMGWGFIASVDIDGKTYSGHALSSSKAKVQASEQALKHLLLEQLSKAQAPAPPAADNKAASKEESIEDDENMDVDEKGEGEESKPKRRKIEVPEDDVPWGSLAAFALHKLFDDWQKEGSEVMHSSQQVEKYEEEIPEEAYFARRPAPPTEYGYPRRYVPGGGPYGRGRGFGPYPPRGPPPPGFGPPRRPPPPAANYFPGARSGLSLGASGSMLPMKKIPEDANQRHPVMLLNQLKPNVVYNETREGEPPRVIFNISVEIDGKEYVGRGKSKKEAKKNVAKAALAPLGISYPDDE